MSEIIGLQLEPGIEKIIHKDQEFPRLQNLKTLKGIEKYSIRLKIT